MPGAYAIINSRTTSYDVVKRQLNLSARGSAKFDVLNAHLPINGLIMPGQIIVIGDDSTLSCTQAEASLMHHAQVVSLALKNYPPAADGFLVENYDLLQNLLSYGSIGIGSSTGGWSAHLNDVSKTLQEIETLYRQHRSKGAKASINDFIAQRKKLYATLDRQLQGVAKYGTSLGGNDSIKRMLGISTKSYLHHGEIAGYAERIRGIARLSSVLKSGTYVGIALDFASTALEIKEACAAGSTEQCEKARYVEAGKFVGSVGGSYIGGSIGGNVLLSICKTMQVSHGGFRLGCAIIGGAVGGFGGGEIGGVTGEKLGDFIYKEVKK